MTSAIIVAAGKSSRMGGQMDKMFLTVAGKPIVAHTWQRFDRASCIDEIILVVRDEMRSAFRDLADKYRLKKTHRFATGGKERQDSVWNGLQALDAEADIVAIQDAARPCTTLALIQATIDAARNGGAAVAAQPVTDTIKQSNDGISISRHLNRSTLWAVQTPQTFRVDVIRRALGEVRASGAQVTDDTAACELIGQAVTLVPSTAPNPKITLPDDVPWIELLLKKMADAPSSQ